MIAVVVPIKHMIPVKEHDGILPVYLTEAKAGLRRLRCPSASLEIPRPQ
jgi:hypothetical protein